MSAPRFKGIRLNTVVVGACLFFGLTAEGTTIFVKADAAGANDGTSWTDAFKELRSALAVAVSGDQIWVAAGTYTPDYDVSTGIHTLDRTSTFQLKNGVSVYGGFAGNEDPATFNLADRDLAACKTILSGDLAGNDGPNFANNTENSYNVLTGSRTDSSALLDGFTISGGNANGYLPNVSGGGMHNSAGNPTLANSIFTGNTSWSAGAILNTASSPTLLNCAFIANSAFNGCGGGIRCDNNSKPILTNCTFIGNSALYDGGGICVFNSSPVLTNCTFKSNSIGSSGFGGAVYVSGGNPTLINCVLWANSGAQIHGSPEVRYSCVQGGWPDTGNINADPCLLPDGRLRRGSPCIDAGDNAAVPAGIAADSAGKPRFVDDPNTPATGNPGDPPKPIVDMGACEYQPVPAKRLYVSAGAAAGGNGQNWATACKYLQDALSATETDPSVTEIWVSAGVYRPDRAAAHPGGTGSRETTFQLIGGLAIVGGFAGNEDPATFDLGARDFMANETTLSGDLAGDDEPIFANNGENCYHAVTGGTGPAGILDGFTISGGNADGSYPTYWGGGMYNLGGSPTLINCIFIANSAQFDGAGFYSNGGDPTLTNCAFTGNLAGSDGGGLYNYKGSPALTRCTFSGNRATYCGGGLYTDGGNPALINCAFRGSSGGSAGGGLFNRNGNPSLTNCTFCSNTGGNYGGAGLYNDGGNPVLTNCVVWDNSYRQSSGSPTITYSCIQGGWPGIGNICIDPRLLPDGRLRRGSPCVDAGTSAAVPTGVTTDLAGNPRLLDDPETPDTGDPGSPARAVVDIGAYEYRPAPAERLYVNASATPGGEGQSWATACAFFQDALAMARTRPEVTEIWVAQGVYKPDRDTAHPDGTGEQAATFQLPNDVAVYGGFPGQPGQEGDLSVRDPAAYPTVLNGDLAGDDGPSPVNRNENSYIVVTATGVGPATMLDGFIVSGGKSSYSGDAGGIANTYGSPILNNCRFIGNSDYGLSNEKGNPVVTNCVFGDGVCNLAMTSCLSGDGMLNENGNPTLTNCTFSACGMSSVGDPTLTNCLFVNGAGMGSDGWKPALINCTFVGNGRAGGLRCNGTPTLTNCTVVGNSGVGIASTGNPSLVNCIVWSNGGAAISGTATVTHCCIEGGWPGTGNISSDPKVMFDVHGSPRLRLGSPCIDAGNNAALPPGLTADLAGNPRLVDDPATLDTGDPGSPPRPVVDMGAYEYGPVPARRLHVNGSAPLGGDGASWATACAQLQDALLAAQVDPGVTEIWVAGGVYKPDRDAAHPGGTGDRDASFQLPGGVAIYGGFPGQSGQEGDFSVRHPATYPTVLSGDLAGNDGPSFGNYLENSYHVVTADGLGPTTVFDGFTVSGGNASGNTPPYYYGGGVYVSTGSLTLTSCIFIRNATFFCGGGMYAGWGSHLSLTNCTFSKNSRDGLWTEGYATLTNCALVGNTENGMVPFNGTSTLVNCTLSGNSAGGLRIPYATVALTNCILWGNEGGPQIDGSATVTHSCVEGGWPGAGNIDIDPLFVDPGNGDFQLALNSPCIDAGDNSAVPADVSDLDGDGDMAEPIPFDLAGMARFFDDLLTPDTGLGTPPIVDMGAYEYFCAALESSNPTTGRSLWRNRRNIIRLTFDADITPPDAGAVMIQEMIAGGTYGDDLSAGFTFTVENDGQGQPRVLKIRETASSLQHRKWYAVRNTGGWAGVAPFTVQYVVQVGDANNDGRVLNTDFGWVNAAIPTFSTADDDRRDINGDGRILNTDFGVLNSKIPSFHVAKPSGH